MAAVLLLIGALVTVTGVSLLAWQAGIATAGVLMLLAAIDLRR